MDQTQRKAILWQNLFLAARDQSLGHSSTFQQDNRENVFLDLSLVITVTKTDISFALVIIVNLLLN